ncbi:hypothetical protein AVEN_177540-1 [Araneus ventricosus]|uniref:Uncharacterized protein n=1 Tax=Araneus ventricosus TaxID=182803 RepID=A0A4Y2VG06_ARAVE|nr:hypothetical protein AVEN_65721-1 [Araneus ventricosus]GBO12842.1 hypothetical protein AVEN_176033-1 [Araneus ventricosus]GBO23492.1 hypothetical protein AVEN_100597-1 [Araneus ventricosus]GBO23522.1 hypothetical protein AVEN_177540-1 [Araneus ventricosus]
MAEEIDNVFENDQMYIRYKTDRHESVCVCARNASPSKSRTFSKPVDTNRCVCKECIVCKSTQFSNRSTKIGVCASSLSLHGQDHPRLSRQRPPFRIDHSQSTP